MKLIAVLVFALISSISYASQKAITDTGDEVILYDDGTWEFADKSKLKTDSIIINPNEFIKAKDSTFQLKSTITSFAFWINPKIWSFTKSTNNEAAEYEFQLKKGDLWGMSISEGVPMPIESLASIAFENAKAAAPDAKVIKQEYRTVNGTKVLYMEMQGTLQGIRFTYLGYYYSDDSGSTQFLAYTGTNLIDKYKSEINDFLNGFSVQ